MKAPKIRKVHAATATLVASTSLAVALEAAYLTFPGGSKDPILFAASNVNTALVFQIPATLAGLALASASFLSGSLSNLKRQKTNVQYLDVPQELKNVELNSVGGEIKKIEDGGIDLVNAFYAFLTALVIVFGLDTISGNVLASLPPDAGTVFASSVDSIAQAGPTLLGMYYLVKGGRAIKDVFVGKIGKTT